MEVAMQAASPDRRVAIVIITHNRRADLLRTLERLTQLPEQPRIVLVDNGSTDGTANAVAHAFPQVEVLDAGGNLGAAGRTLGVRHVDEPYVAFCDDDLWWEPGGLRRAADLMDASPRLATITARVLVGPENREDPTCTIMAESPLPREPGMPGPPLLGFLAGASVVRRAAFLGAGGFDPEFNVGGEEQLLAADLAAAGWWMCYVPELTVHHYPSPVRNHARRRAIQVRNALWFAWLRRPLAGAAKRTLDVVRARWRDRATWLGLLEALRGLPWVLPRRRVGPPEVEHGLRLLDTYV
jgi:GT2 family glycosyltransferase